MSACGRDHRGPLVALAACTLVFFWVVTGGTGRLFDAEPFGDFYDYQAASLLQGRLDVPREGIAFEGFVRDGKSYGYFGPTPALLRLPFTLVGIGAGHLSRGFMLAYFMATLVAAYAIFRHARKLVAGETPVAASRSGGALVAVVGLGSTVFFLGSRAYVYHEAILCGVAFSTGSVWFSLRHLAAPDGRWWLGALVGGLLSVHARPPTGSSRSERSPSPHSLPRTAQRAAG